MAECTRSRLHLVLCCSPTRSLLAEWVQQFPSLVAACQVDWFMPWPTDALLEVAARFLAERGVGPQDSPRLGQSMAGIHDLVATQCQVERLCGRACACLRWTGIEHAFKIAVAACRHTMRALPTPAPLRRPTSRRRDDTST